MDMGRALATVRKAGSIKQSELADKIGMNVSSISLIERSQRNPKFSTVEKISDALGVPLLMILVLAMDEKERGELPQPVLDMLHSWSMTVLSRFVEDSRQD